MLLVCVTHLLTHTLTYHCPLPLSITLQILSSSNNRTWYNDEHPLLTQTQQKQQSIKTTKKLAVHYKECVDKCGSNKHWTEHATTGLYHSQLAPSQQEVDSNRQNRNEATLQACPLLSQPHPFRQTRRCENTHHATSSLHTPLCKTKKTVESHQPIATGTRPTSNPLNLYFS